MRQFRRLFAAMSGFLLLTGCAGSPPQLQARHIGYYAVPGGTDLAAQGMPGVPYGGMSGLDRDPTTGLWYLISDDRSLKGPVRFLTARIDADAKGIHAVHLLSAVPLRDAGGASFAPSAPDRPSMDAEAIRLDPMTGNLLWTSEGDTQAGGPPLLMRSRKDGTLVQAIPLPSDWRFDPAQQTGPRPNMTLEGLTLSRGGDIMVSMEAPLIQDGPIPTPDDGGWTRITRLTRGGAVLAQYAYRLDAVPARPAGEFADNGISEIALLDDRHLLVLERAGIQAAEGHFDFDIRLYLAALTGADDIAAVPSLAAKPPRQPVAKRLLHRFDRPDNLEAMSLFTDPATGQCLLLLASDDNFDPRQTSQFHLLAIDGAASCGG